MFKRRAKVLDLSSATARDIGAALSRVGVAWSFDDDGDIRFRRRSGEQPWTNPVFYEFDQTSANFRMRGQFLEGKRIPQGDGTNNWEIPLDQPYRPTTVAQKVVTVYLVPRPGVVNVQIHAAVEPLSSPRPMHIRIIPGSSQVARIERQYPGFVGTEETGPGGTRQFWMAAAMGRNQVDDAKLVELIRAMYSVGLEMFEGPFTGWMYTHAV